MPLIPCPECGQEISDLAEACPHCGRPKTVAAKPGSTHAKTALKTFLAAIAVSIAFTMYSHMHYGNNTTLLALHTASWRWLFVMLDMAVVIMCAVSIYNKERYRIGVICLGLLSLANAVMR